MPPQQSSGKQDERKKGSCHFSSARTIETSCSARAHDILRRNLFIAAKKNRSSACVHVKLNVEWHFVERRVHAENGRFFKTTEKRVFSFFCRLFASVDSLSPPLLFSSILFLFLLRISFSSGAFEFARNAFPPPRNVMARTRAMRDDNNTKVFFHLSFVWQMFKEICHLRRPGRWRKNNVKGQPSVVKRLLSNRKVSIRRFRICSAIDF